MMHLYPAYTSFSFCLHSCTIRCMILTSYLQSLSSLLQVPMRRGIIIIIMIIVSLQLLFMLQGTKEFQWELTIKFYKIVSIIIVTGRSSSSCNWCINICVLPKTPYPHLSLSHSCLLSLCPSLCLSQASQSRQKLTHIQTWSAPRCLPVKRQFFVATVTKCLFMVEC